MHVYQGYGLTVRSEIPLDDWESADSGSWDVEVRVGDTPTALNPSIATGARWTVGRDAVLVYVNRIGRYLIKSGRQIIVTPERGATDADLAFGLVGAAVCPLLHQRRSVVLHASAISVESGAVAIAGHSAAGKSTLLLKCLSRGAAMITDDIASVDVSSDGSGAYVAPGVGLLNVWTDTAEHFDYQPDRLTPVRDRVPKFKIRPQAVHAATAQKLKAVVVLEPTRTGRVRCEPLAGAAAFMAVRTHIRGFRIAESLEPGGQFKRVSQVASTVPVFRLERPHSTLQALDELADHVFETAR